MQLKKILLIYFLLFNTISIIAVQPSITLINITDPSQPRSTIVSPSIKQQNFDLLTENTNFWLTTNLLNAEFRKGCFSTALCHKPKFKIINKMTINGEESIMSWLINDGNKLVQNNARSFVTYWKQGDPEDIEISCQISGTDPSFGFARICDETSQERVFNNAKIERTLNVNSRWNNINSIKKEVGVLNRYHRSLSQKNSFHDSFENNEDDNQIIVVLHGRCFNVTLAIRKHLKRCPWCPDPNLNIVVSDQQSNEKNNSNNLNNFYQKIYSDDALFFHNLIILALSGAAVFCFFGFCFALFIHCRYRKKQQRKANGIIGSKQLLKFAALPSKKYKNLHKKQCFSNTISSQKMHKIIELNKKLSTGLQIEQKYETPWENKYQPFQHQWPSSDSNSHYQTLTITRSNINNYNCASEYVPDNITDYSNTKQKNDLKQQKKNQQSSLNITDCSGQCNSSSCSSDTNTGPSTSDTTIVCESLCSNGNHCCNNTENYCINGNCINILPVINYPPAAAAFATLTQNEFDNQNCETLNNKASIINNDYNKILIHNNGVGTTTIPSKSFYSYQHHHHYPQLSPPTVPPPPIFNQNFCQDNKKVDSV